MKTPSSRHLTHKYPVWQGCALNEVILIGGIVILLGTLLAIFLGKITGYAWLEVVIFALVTMIGPKMVLRRYAERKKGQQFGYLIIKYRLFVEKLTGGFIKAPYLIRNGRWSIKSIRKGK